QPDRRRAAGPSHRSPAFPWPGAAGRTRRADPAQGNRTARARGDRPGARHRRHARDRPVHRLGQPGPRPRPPRGGPGSARVRPERHGGRAGAPQCGDAGTGGTRGLPRRRPAGAIPHAAVPRPRRPGGVQPALHQQRQGGGDGTGDLRARAAPGLRRRHAGRVHPDPADARRTAPAARWRLAGVRGRPRPGRGDGPAPGQRGRLGRGTRMHRRRWCGAGGAGPAQHGRGGGGVSGLDWSVLDIDYEAEAGRICAGLREAVATRLRRRGVVVAISGGIDSSVCAALAVRALGPAKVHCLILPERDSDPDSAARAALLADTLGVQAETFDIAPALEAIGAYAARDAAVRTVQPGYADDWRMKLAITGGRDGAINRFRLVAQSPDGDMHERDLRLHEYLTIVAATSYKQRLRKSIEYFHADRLHYAVVGTPNRLEYDQGF